MKNRKRVERILRIKERIRDARRARMAQAQLALVHAETELKSARQQRNMVEREIGITGDKAANDLFECARQVEVALVMTEARKEALEQELATFRQTQDETAYATREVKALDRVRERIIQDEQAAEARAEQRLLDEAAQRKVRLG